MNRSTPALAFVGLLLGQASALSDGLVLPGGGWIGWQCDRGGGTPHCELRRLDTRGRTLATADSSGTGIWPGPLLLSPDGQTVYSTGERLAAREAQTLKLRWTAPLALPNPMGGGDSSPLAASPDGKVLAVAGKAGDLAVRDARSGRLQQTIPHPRRRLIRQDDGWNDAWYLAVTALAYDPAGRQLAIGSRGGGIRLRDLTAGQERLLSGHCGKPRTLAHCGPVVGLVWTRENVLVSAANDETLRR